MHSDDQSASSDRSRAHAKTCPLTADESERESKMVRLSHRNATDQQTNDQFGLGSTQLMAKEGGRERISDPFSPKLVNGR